MARLTHPRPIEGAGDCSDFQCGEFSLDQWVRARALRNERGGASRTFVSVDLDTDRVAGYYCLSASALRSDIAAGALGRNMPNPIQVILVGGLAVDHRDKGAGLGASLL